MLTTSSSSTYEDGFSTALPDAKVIPRLIEFNRLTTSAFTTGHPLLATSPGEVGHLSIASVTPSPSLSAGQPVASTLTPCSVSGHLSCESCTPSLSPSAQPSKISSPARLGHLSFESSIPSPSLSGQPAKRTTPGTSGHLSSLSATLS